MKNQLNKRYRKMNPNNQENETNETIKEIIENVEWVTDNIIEWKKQTSDAIPWLHNNYE
jgi:hypothetical protein